MFEMTLHRWVKGEAGYAGWGALLFGSAVLGLLWFLQLPLRETYVLHVADIPHFAESLLLAPDANWQDWFTRGYSNISNLYPDRPANTAEATYTDFTRPAFQFLLYLASFV